MANEYSDLEEMQGEKGGGHDEGRAFTLDLGQTAQGKREGAESVGVPPGKKRQLSWFIRADALPHPGTKGKERKSTAVSCVDFVRAKGVKKSRNRPGKGLKLGRP